MTDSLRVRLTNSMLPHAQALNTFEAPETQTGVPAGGVREYVHFHVLAKAFLSELADKLAGEYGGSLPAGSGDMHWRKIVNGRRVCYVPCAPPPFNVVVAGIPRWLSWKASERPQFSSVDESGAWEGAFRFKGVIGLIEEGCPPVRILTEYVTGKSSEGEKMDGNAHERLSYKVLQYLDAMHNGDPQEGCELFVFGNGAFTKYTNRFYPATQRHLELLAGAFSGFRVVWAVEVEDFLGLALRIVDWLGEPSPSVMIRRRGLGTPRNG